MQSLIGLTLAAGAGVLAGVATTAWWSATIAAILAGGVVALFAAIAGSGYADWYDDFQGADRMMRVGAPAAFLITLIAAIAAHWAAQ